MKKRILSGVAVLGLLLLGAATLPQEPVSSDPVVRQTPPSFRDVLRGRVGQECDIQLRAAWTLTFPANDAEARESVKQDLDRTFGALAEVPGFIREQALATAINELRSATLVAVGQDFVQLREADGTERFIPLSRVDVVVRPDK